MFSFDGDLVHLVAHHNFSETRLEDVRKQYPMRPTRAHVSGRAILSGSIVQIADVGLGSRIRKPRSRRAGASEACWGADPRRRRAHWGDRHLPAGARALPRPADFAARRTFADQAVIAIENVRLFTELEARNRDLTEALEQQTATAEILRVISSSPTDVQPVFDAIAMSATRLCEADLSGLYRFDGELIHFVAHHGRTKTRSTLSSERSLNRRAAGAQRRGQSLRPPSSRSPTSVRILIWTIHSGMFRTVLAVPLMREGRAHGAIAVARRSVRPFNDKQMALLQTFADQAVIAIENVRLFTELQASNRELTTALDKQTATKRHPARDQPVSDECPAGIRRDPGQRRPLAAGVHGGAYPARG